MDITIYVVCGIFIVLSAALIICTKIYGADKLINFLNSAGFKTAVSVIAAVVMYFTPDDIDKYIIMVMSMLGITPVIIGPIPQNQNK